MDSDGAINEDRAGNEIEVTDSWLRYKAYPPLDRPGPAPEPPEDETPGMALARLKGSVARVSSELEECVDQIERLVDDAGTPLVEQQGWANEVVLARLNGITRRLTYWDGLAQRLAARAQL
jgi:hypothetical protein